MVNRKSVTRLPRHISPASIKRGDTIRVVWTTGDVKRTIEGVVAKREYEGTIRIFSTADGTELFRWHPAIKTNIITLLLAEKPEELNDTPMLDFFEEAGRL